MQQLHPRAICKKSLNLDEGDASVMLSVRKVLALSNRCRREDVTNVAFLTHASATCQY